MGHTAERCICQNGTCNCSKSQREVLADNLANIREAQKGDLLGREPEGEPA